MVFPNNAILKYLFLLWVLGTSTHMTDAQSFINTPLSKADKRAGILANYQRKLTDFDVETSYLTLYRNHTFKYSSYGCITGIESSGTWKQSGTILVLNSFYGVGNLPVTIGVVDTIAPIFNDFRILPVTDAAGQELKDALIKVNEDSTRVMPYFNYWLSAEPANIRRINVTFGSNLTSVWKDVSATKTAKIKIVVDTSLDIEKYVQMRNVELKKDGNDLKVIKWE